MLHRLFALTALLCLSSALHAQSEPPPMHYTLFGGYSYFSNSINGVPGSRQALNGWNAAITFPFFHDLKVRADVSSYRGNNLNAPQHPYFILGGAQFNHHFGREMVFVDGLIGDGGINNNWGANGVAGETASFSAVLGGGLDTRISRRFAFRAEADSQYAYFWLSGKYAVPYRVPNLPNHFFRLSSGVVWSF